MTWTNAFDLGACTVEVYAASDPSHPDYTGVLAKGAGADLVLASTWSMHVAVSALGVVTLMNTSGAGLESDAGVRIVPMYALGGIDGARAKLPVSASGSGGATANGDLLDGFTNGDAYVDLSAMSPYNQIAAQTNTIGSSSASVVVQFTPEFGITDMVAAPDESLTVAQNSANNAITPVITLNGAPTAADSLSIDSGPSHGTASVSGTALLYTPATGYDGADSFTYSATVSGTGSNTATVDVLVELSVFVRQMTTHHINRGIDSPVTCYARTENGRPNLTGVALSAVIRAYGGQHILGMLDATGDANGKIDFTVPAHLFAGVGLGYDYGLSCDPRNLVRCDVLANGALVYQALMEVA